MAVNCPFATSVLLFSSSVLLAAAVELNVVGNRVNLRSRPEAEAEVVGQVSTGEKLTAPDGVPEGAEWIKVIPPQAVDLWIFSSLVTDGVVNADDVYVRCGPGPQFKPVGKIQRGEKVTVRGIASGDWLRIAPVRSAALYINSAYVLAIPPEAPVKEAEGEAAPATAEQAANAGVPVGEAVVVRPVHSEAPTNVVPEKVAVPEAKPEAAVEKKPAEAKPEAAVEKKPVEAKPKAKPGAVEEPAPAVPQLLAGRHPLAPTQKQGVPVKIIGRLERDSSAVTPDFSRYLLVDKAGNAKSSVICRVIGLTGQLYELRGSEIEVTGRLWTLAGDAVPILDATSIYRIASWE